MDDIFQKAGSILSDILKSDAAKNIVNAVVNNGKGGSNSDIDVAAGLKEALKIGIETAAKNLGQKDGFLGDIAVRIGLPQESTATFNAIQSLASNAAFSQVLNMTGTSIPDTNTFVSLFNRAAEDAAPKSVDIFSNAITGMTMNDAQKILFGASNAATLYLQDKTTTQLQSAFKPTITKSLDTIQVASLTPTKAWNIYATYNNKLAEMLDSSTVKAGLEMAYKLGVLKNDQMDMIRSVKQVNTDISDYITGKALTGLFLKVAEKEGDIRTNASARVNDVLKNVFGLLDKK